jgi:hypothetical protein
MKTVSDRSSLHTTQGILNTLVGSIEVLFSLAA